LITRWTLLTFVLLFGIGGWTQADGPVKNPGVFVDVPADHWAAESLIYLVERGIIEGLPDGRFQGDRAPSRYEMAALLARALQYLEGIDGTTEPPLRPEDLKVLQDLIFKISDRLQQLSSEVEAIKAARPEIDPELAQRIRNLESQAAEIQELRAQLQRDQQTIRELKNQITQFQIRASTVSEEAIAQTNQQIIANRIIGLVGLLFAVVGIALTTLR
jgi:heat shock factor-binding protein 1